MAERERERKRGMSRWQRTGTDVRRSESWAGAMRDDVSQSSLDRDRLVRREKSLNLAYPNTT